VRQNPRTNVIEYERGTISLLKDFTKECLLFKIIKIVDWLSGIGVWLSIIALISDVFSILRS